eukprot:5204484-Pleurochrysis_carterae.AAC.6
MQCARRRTAAGGARGGVRARAGRGATRVKACAQRTAPPAHDGACSRARAHAQACVRASTLSCASAAQS